MDPVITTVELTEPNALLTPAEVARLLKMTEMALYYWRRQQIGPSFIKLNGVYGAVRYPRKGLARWLNEQGVITNGHVESAE
jgi:Helix-turn-helix domain